MNKKTMFVIFFISILCCKSNNNNNNKNEEILGDSKFFTNEKENNEKYSWIATKSEERPENWLNKNHALMRLINSNRGISYDFDFNNIATKHDIGFYDIYDIRSNKIKIKYSFDNEKESELTIGISECRLTPEEIKQGNIVCYSAANLYNHSYIFTSLSIPPSKSEDFSKKVLTSKTLKIAFEIFKEPIAFNLENHKKLYKKYQKHFIKEDNNSKTKDTSIKIDKN
ncbi:hypothetical protein KSP41_04900 (plasmid) [Borreliella burgdorferi]|uniref:hypothetical protein n=1 Tax=Borreliella burgdorferi TaxID=139 RepID=UPI000406A648|nr:hypothetical protein [Borreliella burgdorferi]QXG44695.1 hypothetical protein KSP41_04900 [Borreliella burgdorferi]